MLWRSCAGVAFAAANDFVSAAAPPIWVVRSAMRLSTVAASALTPSRMAS